MPILWEKFSLSERQTLGITFRISQSGSFFSNTIAADQISLLVIVAICIPAWYGLNALDFRHPAGIVSLTADTTYTWTVHPARSRPSLAVLVLGSLIVCSYCIAIWGGHWVWGVFAVAVFAWTLQQFWWPTVYSVDQNGIRIRTGLAESYVAWPEILSLTVDEQGGLVRLRRPSRRYLQSRELTLSFAGNCGEVVDEVRQHASEIVIEHRQHAASWKSVATPISSKPDREEIA